MLRIYGAVILLLALNSLKMKQIVVFFAAVEQLSAELISKLHRTNSYSIDLRFGSGFEKMTRKYSRIRNYSEMSFPNESSEINQTNNCKRVVKLIITSLFSHGKLKVGSMH